MATSQITSTNTGQYDQIFALSQGYLNKSFSTLYKASLNGGSQLHTLSVKNISGLINATIGDPEIAIDIFGDQNVIFYIPITGGKMSLRDNDTGDWVDGMPEGGFDLSGCRIAFKVNISMQGIPEGDPTHNDIMARVHFQAASDYSLSKLFMDLSAVSISSVMGAPDTILPAAVLTANADWISFVDKWLETNAIHGTNILGYAISASKPKSAPPASQIPTFEPVWNQFQTSEWRFPADNKPKSGIPDGSNNSLMYLQMTYPHDPPNDPHYSYTGNMVGDGESGALFISRKLFWNEYLIPVLRQLNYDTIFQPTNAHCSNDETSPDWQYGWSIGQPAAQYLNHNDLNDSFWDFIEAPTNWSWSHHDRKSDSGGTFIFSLGCYIDATSQVTVSFQPDSNVITVAGVIDVTIERDTTAAGTAHAMVHAPWHFDIVLKNSVGTPTAATPTAGSLILSVENLTVDAPTVTTDSPKFAAMTAPDGVKTDVLAAIEKVDFNSIAQSIRNGISNAHQFILPGVGTFSTARPRFNTHGDFVCHLEYLPEEADGAGGFKQWTKPTGPQVAPGFPLPNGATTGVATHS